MKVEAEPEDSLSCPFVPVGGIPKVTSGRHCFAELFAVNANFNKKGKDVCFIHKDVKQYERFIQQELLSTLEFKQQEGSSKKIYPGTRPQTVRGAKGYETSGGDDEDYDTQLRAQRSRHMGAHESRHIRAHIWEQTYESRHMPAHI